MGKGEQQTPKVVFCNKFDYTGFFFFTEHVYYTEFQPSCTLSFSQLEAKHG